MKFILQKRLRHEFVCQGKLLDCSIGDFSGIIVCSEWLSGGVTGNLTICSLIGNFFHGNGKFLQKGKPTGPKTQGLLDKLPPSHFFGVIMSKGNHIKNEGLKSERASAALGSDFSAINDSEKNCRLNTEEYSFVIKKSTFTATDNENNFSDVGLTYETRLCDCRNFEESDKPINEQEIGYEIGDRHSFRDNEVSHTTDEDFCALVENGNRSHCGAENKDGFENSSDNFVQSNEQSQAYTEQNVEGHKLAKSKKAAQKKKKEKKRNLWWLKITIISFLLAAFFSFISDVMSSFGNIIVISLLLIFLILGSILFDGIGVAVTSCELAPLVSMSARNVYGARTAIKLVKNAEKVSNICNDVIGDIFGIVSGGCSIVIVLKLMTIFTDASQQLITIIISSLVGAVTIGGKAMLKESAIKNSKEFVMFVSKILAVFSKEERRIRKKHK